MAIQDNMQFIGYGLMIMAYFLMLYEKLGLSVTFFVAAALLILAIYNNKGIALIILVVAVLLSFTTFMLKKRKREQKAYKSKATEVLQEKPSPELHQPAIETSLSAAVPSVTPQETVSESDDSEEEAFIAAKDQSYSPMTMEEYFNAWYRKATTSLQRDELEKQMLNRRVIWVGQIKSIESKADESILIIVEPLDKSYGSTFLKFDKSQRAELLKLHKDQQIRFTGIIEHFVASPFLKNCRILRILG
jgi:hypothetical protein